MAQSQFWQLALKISGAGELTTSVTVEAWDLAESSYPRKVYRKTMHAVRPPADVHPVHALQLALDWAKESG